MSNQIAALLISFLLVGSANVASLSDLKQVQSSEQLAKFIYRVATQAGGLRDLVQGVRSTEHIDILSNRIPVKEIYGTIICERFKGDFGKGFYELGKKYDAHVSCTFRDSQDVVRHFHITVFEQKQYEFMEQFLLDRIANNVPGR